MWSNSSTLYANTMKYVRSIINHLKHSNPFIQLLNVMVKIYMVPYANIQDLSFCHVDQRRVMWMKIIFALMCLNMARLAIIAFSSNSHLTFFLMEYVKLETNQKAFHFACGVILSCPSLMYLVSIQMFLPQPQLFEGFSIILKWNQFYRKNVLMSEKDFYRFIMILNIFVRVYFVFVVTMISLLGLYMVMDMYKVYYDYISVYLLTRFTIMTTCLLFHIFVVATYGIFWLQLFVMVIMFLKWNYSKLNHRFVRSFHSTELNWSKGVESQHNIILSLINDLNRVNCWTSRFSAQTQRFIGIYYYTIILANDAYLFLIVDWRTKHFLRMICVTIFSFIFSLITISFVLFVRVNGASKLVLPHIDHCLFRLKQIRFLKLKIAEIRHQLMNNLVGIDCCRVFIFTSYQNLHIFVAFVLNIFLIVNLFQNYFFTK